LTHRKSWVDAHEIQQRSAKQHGGKYDDDSERKLPDDEHPRSRVRCVAYSLSLIRAESRPTSYGGAKCRCQTKNHTRHK
jgi:hypothetical protein